LGGSLFFHGLLVVLACWVVLRTPDRPAAAKEFVAHAVSGGKSGAPASVHPVQRKPKVAVPAKRLVSTSATATLALPPMKAMTPEVGLAGLTPDKGRAASAEVAAPSEAMVWARVWAIGPASSAVR